MTGLQMAGSLPIATCKFAGNLDEHILKVNGRTMRKDSVVCKLDFVCVATVVFLKASTLVAMILSIPFLTCSGLVATIECRVLPRCSVVEDQKMMTARVSSNLQG